MRWFGFAKFLYSRSKYTGERGGNQLLMIPSAEVDGNRCHYAGAWKGEKKLLILFWNALKI